MELFIIIALVFMALFGIGKGIMIMWILFGLFMFSMYPNVLVLLFGVFMPMMVMWETREKTKKQTRIRPGRLSTVRRGSSKEYDQGWDAASQEVPYKKDPNDRSPGRLKALTGVGKGRDADYDAGWDTAIAGKAYTNNPHKKGTAEYARWACGHNHAGIYGGAKTNES